MAKKVSRDIGPDRFCSRGRVRIFKHNEIDTVFLGLQIAFSHRVGRYPNKEARAGRLIKHHVSGNKRSPHAYRVEAKSGHRLQGLAVWLDIEAQAAELLLSRFVHGNVPHQDRRTQVIIPMHKRVIASFCDDAHFL